MTRPGTLPARSSLAARIRGWTDDTAAVEQRLKDLETFARAHRRRWVMVVVGVLIGMLGWIGGMVKARPGTMVLVGGGAALLNALVGMVNERGWYRWWLVYALAMLDAVLVSVLVVWFGHGGLVAAFFIAVLPYAFDQGHAVGDFLVLISALAYLAASQLHYLLYGGDPGLATATYLETVVFVAVAMGLKRIPAALIDRIREARGIMGEAEQGYLAVRAPGGGVGRAGIPCEELQSHARGDRDDDLDGAARSG